jgi:hypothetical protein
MRLQQKGPAPSRGPPALALAPTSLLTRRVSFLKRDKKRCVYRFFLARLFVCVCGRGGGGALFFSAPPTTKRRRRSGAGAVGGRAATGSYWKAVVQSIASHNDSHPTQFPTLRYWLPVPLRLARWTQCHQPPVPAHCLIAHCRIPPPNSTHGKPNLGGWP